VPTQGRSTNIENMLQELVTGGTAFFEVDGEFVTR
jgi:hypothetical protein